MKSKNIILVSGCFFVLMCIGFPVEAAIKIIYPPQDVWVSTKTNIMQVVGTLDGEKDKFVTVKVKGGKVEGSNKSPILSGAFDCVVILKKGKNQIIVKSQKSEVIRTVYLADSRRKVPKGIKRYYIHPPAEIPSCDTCHQLKGKSPSHKRILPTKANCTEGDCHPKIGKGEYVHGPLGAKVCVFCHNPHGSMLPNEISRSGADLCISCHQESKGYFDQKEVMPPVKEGNCTACHDPHQSSVKFQLKGKTLEGLCFNCHDKKIKNFKVLHGPMQKGDCIACHNPHSSPNKWLLEEKGDEFCFLCHKERMEQFKRKFSHTPEKEGCNGCHTAHGSNFKFQLKDKEPELCYPCHEKSHPDALREMKVAKVKHGAMKDGKCSSCHTVHSTNFEKQLKASVKTICFQCHEELKDEVDSAKYQHGAVKESNCNACHKSHGAAYPSLLLKYYTPEFYAAFTPTAYAMCFECHNKDIVKDKATTKLTDFRNGAQNLHYLHVVKKKGRTCRACHEEHAGDQKKHIRKEIPFGMWSYPIEFTLKKNGGTCVVGCHKPQSYNRVKPVKY